MTILKDFYLNCVAFPLGGLGTGNIALAGDGSLRQWQIVNNVNHLGYVPSSFFFIQTRLAKSGNWVTKILEKDVKIPDDFKPAESVNDHIIPDDIIARHENFNCIQDIEFEGEYPFAKIKYYDDEIPVEIELEAWNPMIPLDVKNSALPIIIFNFEVRNPNKETSVDIRLGGMLLNFIGWDGISEIDLNFYPNFYANKNRIVSLNDVQGIEMISESTVLEDMLQGEIFLASMHKDCMIIPSIASLNNFPEILDTLNSDIDQLNTEKASSHGKTWIGILLNKITLGPLEKKNVIFLLGWSFPNRYLNWDNKYYRRVGVDTKSKFWLGNRYNKWFRHAKDVVQYTVDNFEFLEKTTREFKNLLYNTTIPEEIIDSVSAIMSTVRSPSCFLTKKGEFMGFEGCCGESTALNRPPYGGCCPMNCTHVWNYSVTHSRLYPSLEISMLNNEFMRISSKGLLPHRLVVPTYLPQANNVRIGGPAHPAIDGLFGCILKTYRMLLFTNDFEWFKKAYPKIRRLMDYIFQECDPDEQGVIEGEQPNTYDVSFYGKNIYIGALYLAALKAFEKMANLVYDDDFKEKCIKRFNNGKKNYDNSLWNGEYWIQIYDEKKYLHSQLGTGCLSDQLFGQFWANMLELGSLLPKEKINVTLDSIMKYNFMENFHGFVQKSRIFASEHDKGLLVCSWPKGKRLKMPMIYSDEVWTGMEYEVAALMMENDKIEDALKLLRSIRDRYDGRYRNPWNEVECGDHYVRAMSSWRSYEAAIGYHWNALESRISFLPRFKNNPMQALFITNSSWGMIRREYDGNNLSITIKPLFGELELKILRTWNLEESIDHIFEVTIDGLSLKDNVDINVLNDIIEIKFKENLQIASNQELNVKLKSEK